MLPASLAVSSTVSTTAFGLLVFVELARLELAWLELDRELALPLLLPAFALLAERRFGRLAARVREPGFAFGFGEPRLLLFDFEVAALV